MIYKNLTADHGVIMHQICNYDPMQGYRTPLNLSRDKQTKQTKSNACIAMYERYSFIHAVPYYVWSNVLLKSFCGKNGFSYLIMFCAQLRNASNHNLEMLLSNIFFSFCMPFVSTYLYIIT